MTQDTWTEITADDKPAPAKHTPGPWRVANNGYYLEIRTTSEESAQIGDVCSSKFWNDGKHAEANAKLIAAAPQMLEALRAIMRDPPAWSTAAQSDAYDLAISAIAAAVSE